MILFQRNTSVVLVAVALCAAAPAHAGRPPVFTDTCTWTAVADLAITNIGFTNGVAWIDFDNDGDLDLHYTKAPGSGGDESRLIRNEGDGSFTFLSGSALATTTADRTPSWGDYDNDGDPDCFVASQANNHLFQNNGDGTFTDASTPALQVAQGGGCSWADYDLDGDLDLYVGGSMSNRNALFRNDLGALLDVSAPPLDFTGPTQSVAWGDYDNDMDPDLYVALTGVANRLFRNDGGVFVDASAAPIDDVGGSHGAAWEDYNNDGWLDLFVTNLAQPNRLYRNNGDGTFEDVSTFPLNDAALNSACAWGDYDNDGFADIYYDRAFAPNVLVHNDLVFGEFHFTETTSGPLLHLPLGGGVAWGDYDGDGDLDLAIATLQNDQPSALIRNDCTLSTNWLQVHLEGTLSNRSGVGARVRAVDDGRTQYRWVETTSGFLSQNSMDVQLGFGAASKNRSSVIDSLVIDWPSGLVQTITGIAVNQRITVLEDSTTVGIVVSGFRGEPGIGRVDLEWWASSEHGGDGFFVLRAPSRAGPWRRLNSRPLRGGNPLRFADTQVEPLSTYFYQLETVEAGGGRLLDVISVTTPFWGFRAAQLEPNRPNPFLRTTELVFSLRDPGPVRLTIHDVAGRRLATVSRRTFPAGRQVVAWDGRDDGGRRLPAGVYFYRLDAAGRSEARRLVLLGR